MKNKNRIIDILKLQSAVVIYSLSTVVGKYASYEELLSAKFIVLYMVEFAILVLYALLWQQLIKKFQLSVAYANKAMMLFWSMVWSVFLFHEGISINKVIGVILVGIGTVVLNSGNREEESHE